MILTWGKVHGVATRAEDDLILATASPPKRTTGNRRQEALGTSRLPGCHGSEPPGVPECSPVPAAGLTPEGPEALLSTLVHEPRM